MHCPEKKVLANLSCRLNPDPDPYYGDNWEDSIWKNLIRQKLVAPNAHSYKFNILSILDGEHHIIWPTIQNSGSISLW